MSHAPAAGQRPSLSETVDGGLDRLVRALGGGESGPPSDGLEKELLEVLLAGDGVLETVDLDRLSGSVDVESLRDRIDVERLADAIAERNPDLAVDLSDLEESVDTAELLDSIDLLEFAKRKRRLDAELDDVVDLDGLSELGGDSKAGDDVGEFLSSVRQEAAKTVLREQAREKATAAQEALVDGHSTIAEQYEANRRRFTGANEGGAGRNPTAVSLVSPGALPDGASTRHSTVPSKVRYSKTEAIPRVYSSRWTKTRTR